MQLNGLPLTSFAEKANEVSFVFPGSVEIDQITALDGQTLAITSGGADYRTFAGFSLMSCGYPTQAQGELHARFFRKLEDRTEDAIAALDANVAVAQATAEKAAASVNLQMATFAELALESMAATMADGDALSVSTLWPEWSGDGVSYAADAIVRTGNQLWRCVQAHTSQADWSPEAAPSLWSRIDIAGDGVEVWTQPTGAHDAYNTGDRVHYPTASDPIYVSTIDGNVWAPDAYPQGWQLEAA